MACKVIVNTESGNCNKLDLNQLAKQLGCPFDLQTINHSSTWCANGYDKVVVCGGDGTLHHALNKCANQQLYYAPCGTLNQVANQKQIETVGQVNDQLFTYVCATGSFTPIGYQTRNQTKRKMKAIAYLLQATKHYRCHNMHATLTVDKTRFEGNYTLIMVLKNSKCFAFDFNKCYKKQQGLYVLAITSPGKNTLANKAKLFAPFFRVFFCGVRKPTIAKNWFLLPFERLTVDLESQQDFCIDGEKQTLPCHLEFGKHTLPHPVVILRTPLIK